MNRKLLLALLGCTALALISPRFAPAKVGDPIAGIPIGLEGDPGSIVVATAKTDAEGKFEFKNLKAGNYRLIDQSAEGAGKQTTVLDGAQLQLQRTFTITVAPVNDAPTTKVDNKLTGRLTLPVDPKSGRSSQAITVDMDGGTLRGVLQTAEISGELSGLPRATVATVRDGPEGTIYVATAGGGVWKTVNGPAGVWTGPIVLGVTVQPVDGGGLSITSVKEGSLAQSLGLQTGDQIQTFNGTTTNSNEDLVAQWKAPVKLPAGADAPNERPMESLSLNFLRNG